MENRFCLSKKELRDLVELKTKERLSIEIEKFKDNLTMQEMFDQMKTGKGAFNDAMDASNKKFANKTENTELFLAIDLADFYFPEADSQICFEMKGNFSAANVSYDSLIKGIECDTHIDCSVASGERQFDFQIKRYPQDHLKHSTEAITEYIQDAVRGYGEMKGTILVILLQPNEEPGNIDFVEIHKKLSSIKDEISFDEIDFVFNEMNQCIIWHQVYPRSGHYKKPLIFSSEKYKEIQDQMKNG